MRTIVRTAITGDAALQALGVTPEATLAGDVDTPQGRPFLNLKWGSNLPSFKEQVTVQTTLTIWVHDEPADYARIDRILARLHVLLPSLAGVVSGDSEVQVIEWQQDGPDLQDDGHRTIVKVATFLVVGKL